MNAGVRAHNRVGFAAFEVGVMGRDDARFSTRTQNASVTLRYLETDSGAVLVNRLNQQFPGAIGAKTIHARI